MCTHVRAHSIEMKPSYVPLPVTFGCVLVILTEQMGDPWQICDEKVFIAHFVAIKEKKSGRGEKGVSGENV